ncbi:MAG: OmpA family protein [Acidobacteriota bacterium]
MKRKIIFLIFLSLFFTVFSGNLQNDYKEEFQKLIKGGILISPPDSFLSGQSDPSSAYMKFLSELGKFIKKNKELIIEISGHTDSQGNIKRNKEISLLRAEKVKEYLVSGSGILKTRIFVIGHASSFPIADNTSIKGRIKNRRIEIKSIDPLGKITFIRNNVFTKSPVEIDFRKAKVLQDLFNLYKLNTKKRSTANIGFPDKSSINIGPDSLMILYEKIERELDSPGKENIQLLTGFLRTKLNKLREGFKIDTPACTINSRSKVLLVDISKDNRSAVSVFDGTSEVKAQKKSVDVPSGFGTFVKEGKKPAPPEPLPDPPKIVAPIKPDFYLSGGPEENKKRIFFEWEPKEPLYHIQISADKEFKQILKDEKINGNSISFLLGKGTYTWRVAGINKNGIEGFPALSSFLIKVKKSVLPVELSHSSYDSSELAHSSTKLNSSDTLKIKGKTIPGSTILIKEEPVTVDSNGEFSKTIYLSNGWNLINIIGANSGYKRSNKWISVCYYPEMKRSIFIGMLMNIPDKVSSIDRSAMFNLGKVFKLNNFLMADFSIGISRVLLKEDTGKYKKSIPSLPLTTRLRYQLTPGRKLSPFLAAGLAAHFSFPSLIADNKIDTKMLFTPEVGAGFYFPILGKYGSFEIKYLPFLKALPIFSKLTGNFAIDFRLYLN